MKRLLRRPAIQAVVAWLVATYIRFVYATSRWEVHGGEALRRFWGEGRPFLGCFWHGRMLMMPHCWDYRVPIYMLISQHLDGQLISRAVAHFGVRTVVGSSSRGGRRALKEMVRAIRSGACVAFTPDGPRGPRMRATPGIVVAARLSGAPILPGAYSSTRRRLLESWDRFVLAFPFGRCVLVVGEPIAVPADASDEEMERLRLAVEAELNRVTAEADRRCGHDAVEPAAAPGRPRAAS